MHLIFLSSKIGEYKMATQKPLMRAAIYRRYGGPEVVRIEMVERPVPRPNQVLIKVHAATVTSADWRLRSMTIPKGFGWMARLIFGFTKPRRGVLGTELAGTIAEVGSSVQKFKVGDDVIAYPGASLGAHGEFIAMDEDAAITLKSPLLSFEVAAALGFGGITSLFFLRDGAKLQKGEKVLVIGGSGNVGSAAVQLASHLGGDVTAVCSGDNAELVKQLGAQRVIDYKLADWRKQPKESFDLIFDRVGGTRWKEASTLLKPGGRLLLAVMDAGDLGDLVFAQKKGRRIVFGDAKGSASDLAYLNDLAAHGFWKPLIDKVLNFEQIVEAHRLVDSRRKKGSVVVKWIS